VPWPDQVRQPAPPFAAGASARRWPPVADLHCDTVRALRGGVDLRDHPEGQVDLPRLQLGGVGLQVFACYLPSGLARDRALAETTQMLDALDDACERCAPDIVKVETADQAEAAVERGLIGMLLAVENGHAIDSDLRNLGTLRRRGVRSLTLTHARHLPWAASSGEPWAGSAGLDPFGAEVVREMNALGMIVDVSHVHARTFDDVRRLSRKPFIASHSCAAALCPVERNLTDDQLRAIAGAGGVVGVNFFPGFLDPGYLASRGADVGEMPAERERSVLGDLEGRPLGLTRPPPRAPWREPGGTPRADLDLLVSHIEHIARVAGEDHVAFGSDFDGIPQTPRGVPDCSAFPRILARLSERGFGDASLRKIAWGNFLRVLRAND